MASVFKPKRTVTDPATGKTKRVPYACWYIKYRDGDGIVRKVKGFTDKAATLQRAAELERKAQQAAAGMGDRFEEFRKLPLVTHLAKYSQHLGNKRGTAKHIGQTVSRIEKVLSGCRFRVLGDLAAPVLADWLSAQQAAGTSAQTANHYSTVFRSFLRWLVKAQRMPSSIVDQFSIISRAAVAPDRRLERRSISASQFQHLIQTTASSPETFRGLTGPERSLLYLCCGLTGLRCSEAAALSMQSFNLSENQPTLTLAAKTTKNRKAELLPVHPALAAALRPWFNSRHTNRVAGDAPLWPGTWRERSSKMLQKDLALAEIPFRDDTGRQFDFHAIRGQFISELGRSGVPLQTAQKLARHSDPRLTANHYTHLAVSDLASAIERIQTPNSTSTPEIISLRATGTDTPAILRGPQWDHSGAVSCVFVPTADDTEPVTLTLSTNEKTPENPGFCENSQGLLKVHLAGLEPATFGSVDRCSIQLS